MTSLLNVLLLLTVLPKGTIVKLHLTHPVSSEKVAMSDPVTFEVTEDVKVGDVVVVPKGSKAEGFVSTVISAKLWGYGGVGVYVGSVEAPSGLKIPVLGRTERGGEKEAVISTDTEIVAATEMALPLEQLTAR